MKKSVLSAFVFSLALPAQGQNAVRLTQAQLLELDSVKAYCGEDSVPTSAAYVNDTENRVNITCDDAEGFVPLAVAGLGLGGGAGAVAAVVGVAAVAAAAGGGGSASDTQ